MAVEYICDGCGERAPGDKSGRKPIGWWQREDDDGAQHACSRRCIERAAERTGKTAVVVPL